MNVASGSDHRYGVADLIPGWDQKRIRNTTALLLGVGALGNEAAKNLALLGVGRIVLVDFDLVETNNLFKSVLFTQEDVGSRKVDAAARAIYRMNPDVQVDIYHCNLLSRLPLGVFCEADVVLCALDSWEGRWFTNWLCWETDTPWVDGGLDILDGRVRSFYPGKTACLECSFDSRHYSSLRERVSCGFLARSLPSNKVPATPTSAAIVGGLMVQEAVKILHGNESTLGHVFHFHGNFETIHYEMAVREDCRRSCQSDPLRIVEAPLDVSRGTLKAAFECARNAMGVRSVYMQPYCRFVRALYCGMCEREESLLLPEPDVRDSEFVRCPVCGEDRRGEPLDVFEESDPWSELSLANLGFVDNHLLRFRSSEDDWVLVRVRANS